MLSPGDSSENLKLFNGLQRMIENADETPPPKRTRKDIQSLVESIVDENRGAGICSLLLTKRNNLVLHTSRFT